MAHAVSINVASRIRHRLFRNHSHRAAAVHSCVVRVLRVLDHADTRVLRILLREVPHKSHPMVLARVPSAGDDQLRRTGLAGDIHELRLRFLAP